MMSYSLTDNHRGTGWQLAVAVLLVTLAASSATADQITIRSTAAPRGTVVRLGDVADIRADDSRRADVLASLPLMPAPAPDTRRFLRMREIQDLLAAHGEDLGQLEFNGQTVVEIQSSVLTEDAGDTTAAIARHAAALAATEPTALTERETQRLESQIRDLILHRLANASGSHEPWRVTLDVPERHLRLLRDAKSPPQCEGEVTNLGSQRFLISFTTADGDVRFPVYAKITLPAEVAVAVRPIARGAIVTAADVDMQFVEQLPRASGRRAPITEPDHVIGMEATRSIQAGDTVFTDQVRPPLLVRRGEQITVVARGGGIRVRTQARARQDGARGDLIQVESLETRERYDAQVVGVREAAVFAATPKVHGQSTADRQQPVWR